MPVSLVVIMCRGAAQVVCLAYIPFAGSVVHTQVPAGGAVAHLPGRGVLLRVVLLLARVQPAHPQAAQLHDPPAVAPPPARPRGLRAGGGLSPPVPIYRHRRGVASALHSTSAE